MAASESSNAKIPVWSDKEVIANPAQFLAQAFAWRRIVVQMEDGRELVLHTSAIDAERGKAFLKSGTGTEPDPD